MRRNLSPSILCSDLTVASSICCRSGNVRRMSTTGGPTKLRVHETGSLLCGCSLGRTKRVDGSRRAPDKDRQQGSEEHALVPERMRVETLIWMEINELQSDSQDLQQPSTARQSKPHSGSSLISRSSPTRPVPSTSSSQVTTPCLHGCRCRVVPSTPLPFHHFLHNTPHRPLTRRPPL